MGPSTSATDYALPHADFYDQPVPSSVEYVFTVNWNRICSTRLVMELRDFSRVPSGLSVNIFVICAAFFVSSFFEAAVAAPISEPAEHLNDAALCQKLLSAGMGETGPVIETESVEQSRQNKVDEINAGTYGNVLRGKFKAEALPQMQTIRIFPASGRIPKNAKARAFFFHGGAAEYSHSDSMRLIMYLLADAGGDYDRQSPAKKIRKDTNFTEIAAEAIDLPFHGLGPRDTGLYDVSKLADYLGQYLLQEKAATPHLKNIVVTRSSSNVLMFELMKKYPNAVDGLVLMSPTLPDPVLLNKAKAELLQMQAEGKIRLNPSGMNWIFHQLFASQWDMHSLQGKPTLILSGQADPELQPGEAQFFQSLELQYPNIIYVSIPNAGHDVFRTAPSYNENRVVETAKAVEEFFHNLVSHI